MPTAKTAAKPAAKSATKTSTKAAPKIGAKPAVKAKSSAKAPATAKDGEKQVAEWIARVAPEKATFFRAARRKMRALLPTATEVVYDYRTFVVISYAPGDKGYEAAMGLSTKAAKGLSLFFGEGATLPDPHKLLRGGGKLVRGIELESMATFDRPELKELIKIAISRAKMPAETSGKPKMVIK